jgi:hypothetical protein
MKCEQARELLPDYTLGTLSDLEGAAIRRHLRGCTSCRSEGAALDQGVALFASAVHEVQPPPELKARVMSVLSEEWADPPAVRHRRPWAVSRSMLLAAAAVVVLLAGTVSWGAVAQMQANRFSEDATSYRTFLRSLGGKEVRVAPLHSVSGANIEGSGILYDSDKGQSWVLVLGRAPGYTGSLTEILSTPSGQSISLRPSKPDTDGDISNWLVTSSDISQFTIVRVLDDQGRVVATGRTQPSGD